jgi:hypothetical protein
MSHRTWTIVRLDNHRRVAVAKHVKDASWLKRAVQKLANKLHTKLAAFPAPKHNPSSAALVIGETWKRRDGSGRDRIADVSKDKKRVQATDTDAGTRAWMTADEFRETHIPPRATSRNPSRLTPGTRVSATIYGVPREGTVLEQRSEGIVWVRWDGSPRKTWQHRDSPEKHQLRIARDSFKYTPAMLGVVGGPSHAEAREIIYRLTGKYPKESNPGGPRIVYNRLLGGWYVVTGPHQTPLNGRFNSKAEAQAWLGRRNPRSSGRKSKAAERAERLTVSEQYWIESSTPAELASDPSSPYRMVTSGGQRFALSASDAIRSQKQGLEFRARRGNPVTHRASMSGGAVCGAPGRVRISTSGVGVTCPACLAASTTPSRAQAMEQIREAAARFRSKRNPARAGTAYFDRFKIKLPAAAVFELTGQGDKTESASYWADRIKRPADVTPELLRAELKEYGAWDASELGDDAENWRRILWIAAGNISEAEAGRTVRQKRGNPSRSLRGRFTRAERKRSPRGVPGSGSRRAARALRQGRTAKAHYHQLSTLERGRFRPNSGRRKRSPRAKRNPRSADDRAHAMFQKWHDFPSDRTKRVRVPSRTIPKQVVGLGKVVRIDYISNKWEGKPVTYTHSTKRPYPELVTDPDGRQLYLVGGRMKPTADGLVN